VADHASFVGVRIDGGLQPFQIVQQDARGVGSFRLTGRWKHPENRGTVQLRVVREDDAVVVVPWQDATRQDAATWDHTFDAVPAGGLYRIESRLLLDPNNAEWSPHGDIVHHLGVGDLWIIAGQSNAAGYGRGPVNDPPRLGVHVLRNDEVWDIATHILNETTRSTHPNLEAANPAHSPYLSFAKALNTALGYPIGLIQTALGGSPLAMWNPIENPDAVLWKNLLHCLNLAGGRAKGMVWYQGESDCGPETSKTYERRFADFIHRLRTEIKNPDLAVIVTQLNRCPSAAADAGANLGWTIVREAQRNAPKIGKCAVVPAIDLGLSDGIHTSPDGNLTLGKRSARAALEIAYNRPGQWRAPNIVSATLAGDGKAVDLTFEHVANRLLFLGPAEKDFVVEDSAGRIPVTKATVTGRTTIRLDLERPAGADTKVHGAYGTDPPADVRDAEENTPMLGFYGFPVKAG
jgi:sialate O-acetylesterase